MRIELDSLRNRCVCNFRAQAKAAAGTKAPAVHISILCERKRVRISTDNFGYLDSRLVENYLPWSAVGLLLVALLHTIKC